MTERRAAELEIAVRVLSDAEHGLVRALTAGAPESDNTYPARALAEEMAGDSQGEIPENRVIFGLFADGRLAAVGCGTVEDGGRGYISRVYAAAPFRGRGIGRRLTNHIESYLREGGCDTAYIHCWSPMTGTQRFWMKMGYARVASRAHRHDGVFGAVIRCEKPL